MRITQNMCIWQKQVINKSSNYHSQNALKSKEYITLAISLTTGNHSNP